MDLGEFTNELAEAKMRHLTNSLVQAWGSLSKIMPIDVKDQRRRPHMKRTVSWSNVWKRVVCCKWESLRKIFDWPSVSGRFPRRMRKWTKSERMRRNFAILGQSDHTSSSPDSEEWKLLKLYYKISWKQNYLRYKGDIAESLCSREPSRSLEVSADFVSHILHTVGLAHNIAIVWKLMLLNVDG